MDSSLSPALWVGTSLGTVLAISLNMPPPGEQRLLQPVIVSPSGEFIFIYNLTAVVFIDVYILLRFHHKLYHVSLNRNNESV